MNRFNCGQIVMHRKTENLYKITEEPIDSKRLEYCNEPYYKYVALKAKNKIEWARSKSEFEKKFIPNM